MVEHDGMVGAVLKQLDDLGIADNTIVVYSTDNGAETVAWPDGGTTPFHGEKGTTWEGGFRVPLIVRWPGVIKPGTVYNDIISQEDWMPTLLAAAGEPDVVEKLKKGYKANGKTFKVHLDGYNFLPYFKGEVDEGTAGGDLLLRPGRRTERHPLERLEDSSSPPRVGNIATGTRSTSRLAAAGQPARRPPTRRVRVRPTSVPSLVYGDNMWTFVPARSTSRNFWRRSPTSLPGGQQPERRGNQPRTRCACRTRSSACNQSRGLPPRGSR